MNPQMCLVLLKYHFILFPFYIFIFTPGLQRSSLAQLVKTLYGCPDNNVSYSPVFIFSCKTLSSILLPKPTLVGRLTCFEWETKNNRHVMWSCCRACHRLLYYLGVAAGEKTQCRCTKRKVHHPEFMRSL